MDTQKVRKYKFFWAWQDRQQEQWLQKMSSQGLHLRSLGWWKYVFEPGEPNEYSYRLDFLRTSKQNLADYLEIFEGAGWEHIGKFDGWQYFRKPAENGIEEEIYTDTESKIEKYRRMLWYFLLGTPGFLIVLLYNLERYPPWFATLMVVVIVSAILFGGLNSLMITLRIRELQNR